MSGITTCPRCHADVGPSAHVTERGLVCPHCQNPLGGAGLPGLDAPDVDTDVRRGISWTTLALGFFITLNVAGIGLAYTSFTRRDRIGLAICFGLLFALLDVLVIVAILRPLLLRWMAKPFFETPSGWVVQTLVVLGVGLGVVIVFFLTCQGLLALR